MSHIEYFAEDSNDPAAFRMKHSSIPITEEMETDPALDEKIFNYEREIKRLYGKVVGELCEPLALTEKVVRSMDAPIGHLFTDAQLNFYGRDFVDVAVMNGGGIRTNTVYRKGPITLGHILQWSSFRNKAMVVETDGASLKKFITREMALSCDAASKLNGMYVHPAGIQYTFECTGEHSGRITSLEWLNHPKRNGPVLDTETLNLALTDYLYKSEFKVIPDVKYNIKIKKSEAAFLDSVLEQYFESLNGRICVNDETVRSRVTK